MLIPGSFLRCSQEGAHSAGARPAPPNAAFHAGKSGRSLSVRESAAFEQRVALPVALGPKFSQGRQGGRHGVRSHHAEQALVDVNSVLPGDSLDSTAAQRWAEGRTSRCSYPELSVLCTQKGAGG